MKTYLDPIENITMEYEINRISSFRKFPSKVSALRLSQAGFFATGVGDQVECCSCHIKFKTWNDDQNPWDIHRKYSPDCEYIINNAKCNIPLASKAKPGYVEPPICRKDNTDSRNTENIAPISLTNWQREPDEGQTRKPLGEVQVPRENVQSFTNRSQRYNKPESGGISAPTSRSNNNLPQNDVNSAPISNNNFARNFASTTQVRSQTLNSSPSSSHHSQPQTYTQRNQTHPSNNVHINYKHESHRLHSFNNWPSNAPVSPPELASNGFYYMGEDDRVQCAFCLGILRNWEAGDHPDGEHRRHFGRCPFLQDRQAAGNVTIAEDGLTPTDQQDSDFCRGIVTEKPVHAQFSLPSARLATFKDFPQNMTQTPEKLSKAGFFYTGTRDNLKCFFCDGGLRNWEPNDEPWTEHARWFPRCGYLRLCKGDEYVKEIQERLSAPVTKPPAFRKTRRGKKHKVEETKVKQYMEHPITKSVMTMGYDREKVKAVIVQRLEDLGDHFFPNAEALLDTILEYDENSKYTEVHGDSAVNDGNHNNASDDISSSDGQLESVENNPNTTEGTAVGEPQKAVKKKNKKKKKKKSNDSKQSESKPVIKQDTPLQFITSKEAKALEADVERMKEERLCKVCMDEEVNTVFLRCGHLVCCSNCAPALRHCPICREQIRGTVRVFLS